jgi:hypothetical protein
MPRVDSRLWRFLLSLTLIGGLLATPAAVSADGVVRFSEHAVNLFCDAAGEEGELHLFAGSSSEFGEFAELFADAAPVNPELGPDISGATDQVVVAETAAGATLDVTIPLVDREENAVGSAVIHAEMTLNGDVFTLEPFRDGNRWVRTTGTIAFMDVTGTLDLPEPYPDFTLEFLGCGGEIVDVEVFETQPHAFVNANEGIILDCFWEDAEGTFAFLFAVNDEFGTFADTGLFSEGVVDLFGSSDALTFDATGFAAEDIPLFDFLNNVPDGSASADATLSLLGEPFTSTVLSQNSRERVTQQGLLPDGTLVFPTGDEFVMDDEHCFAATFDSHFAFTPSAGPKTGGKAPVNDTPDGALAIPTGGSVNAQTGATAPDAEMQVTTCPDFADAFGHTLWYTFTGTGEPVTIDPAGSNFDTVLAVYDDELNELACIDDNEFEPVGFTFQGALMVDTEEGATYYVQAGGYSDVFFDPEAEAQFGRLRLSID